MFLLHGHVQAVYDNECQPLTSSTRPYTCMNITGSITTDGQNNACITGAFYVSGGSHSANGDSSNGYMVYFDASRTWTGSTSSASVNTSNMGSGTSITNNPLYISVKLWKRLS